MRNKIGIAILTAILVLAISACQRNNNGAPDQANPPAASPSGSVAAADAEALYQSKCIACHAADLHGGVGPNLQAVGSKLTVDDIVARISAGGGGMPAFKGTLTDAEISSLAIWLAAKKG